MQWSKRRITFDRSGHGQPPAVFANMYKEHPDITNGGMSHEWRKVSEWTLKETDLGCSASGDATPYQTARESRSPWASAAGDGCVNDTDMYSDDTVDAFSSANKLRARMGVAAVVSHRVLLDYDSFSSMESEPPSLLSALGNQATSVSCNGVGIWHSHSGVHIPQGVHLHAYASMHNIPGMLHPRWRYGRCKS